MLTDEQINYHSNGCCTSGECNIGRKALGDEIMRLRRTVEFQEKEIVMYLDSLQIAQEELARYRTPNVDEIEVKV